MNILNSLQKVVQMVPGITWPISQPDIYKAERSQIPCFISRRSYHSPFIMRQAYTPLRPLSITGDVKLQHAII